ncbi:MAG: hypothetical protein RJQ08_03780 [Salinisphaeraceae bacterium]
MVDYSRPFINADAVFRNDNRECAKLYRQFCQDFGGSLARIRAYYRWRRAPLVRALRIGREVHGRITGR